MSSEVEALIGFGGNVGDVRRTLAQAIDAFCDGVAVRLLARSSDYRTPPWGVADQPPFVNLCIATATKISPQELLVRALLVERRFGRDRSVGSRWGPRTLDIDLLTYGDLALDTPELVLPHPRVLERAFVLAPLAEIRPDAVIAGERVGAAAARLDSTGIERLPPL
jgi:2-amino-4-hydroxy-6-hydroxymethyldihydropteridine diphosphokinase